MREGTEHLERLLADQAVRAARSGLAVSGRFLPDAERALAIHAARQAGAEAAFDGGYDEAERVQVSFFPEGGEPVFTGRWIGVRWNPRFAAPDHRALLGSLMALGIDRSYAGDLIASEKEAWLYCLPPLAERLPGEWREAGRTAIEAAPLDEPPSLILPEGAMLRDTVPSLRLDAVLSAALRTSRTAAAERIRRGEVEVNHRQETRVDRALQPGDLLSVRHTGRVRLREVGDRTRKDRLPVILECFFKP